MLLDLKVDKPSTLHIVLTSLQNSLIRNIVWFVWILN